MTHPKKGKISKRLIPVLLILFLFPAITKTIQIAHGQTIKSGAPENRKLDKKLVHTLPARGIDIIAIFAI
jgi:hypothetical protein